MMNLKDLDGIGDAMKEGVEAINKVFNTTKPKGDHQKAFVKEVKTQIIDGLLSVKNFNLEDAESIKAKGEKLKEKMFKMHKNSVEDYQKHKSKWQ